MKDILEKFGLGEFFAFVSPGIILLSSLVIWFKPNFESALWQHEAVVVTVGVILSYTLGLIIASFNQGAQARYFSVDLKRRGVWRRMWNGMVRVVYRFPSPNFTEPIVDANLRIAEVLEQLSGVRGMSKLASASDRLVVFRTLVADQVGDKGKSVLTQADNFHRRVRFCMGVSLSVLLLGAQGFLRLILAVVDLTVDSWAIPLPGLNPLWLGIGCCLSIWASFKLRGVAIQMWDLEMYLTASLARPELDVPSAASPAMQPDAF